MQGLALKAYTQLPSSVTPGPGKHLKAVNEAVSSVAKDAAEGVNTVVERMRNNGWYGVASSPPGHDSISDDEYSPAPAPARSRARASRRDRDSRGDGFDIEDQRDTGSASTGEGWKIWQGAYDRVKWQSVNDKVKDVAAAVKKKYAGDEGLCESDEEDFQGPGDSHLTRVMKEYYIDNSRSQADLPVWLFPEVDRHDNARAWEDTPPPRPTRGRRSKSQHDDSYSYSSGSSRDGRSRERHDPYGDQYDRYDDRFYRSSVPSTYARESLPRSDSGSYEYVSSSGRMTESPRSRPSEHGSRTAEKLKRMKAARNT